MKKTINIALVLFALIITFVSLKATDTGLGISGEKHFELNLKVGSPELKFISTAPLEEIIGYVKKKEVKSHFMLDPSDIESAHGTISFKVAAIETGISMRDEHLQSKMWLDAEKYPEIVFELKKFTAVKVKNSDKEKGKSEISATAVGTYKMHGKSKEIEIPVTIIYIKESDKTRKRAEGDFVSIKGEFQIALKDFDVKGKKGVVGKKVGETIDISFNLYYSSK